MSSLRGIKARQKNEELKLQKNNRLIKLGTSPQPTRNRKIEKTWDALLAEPSVSYSDPNTWSTPADVRPSSFPFCPRKYALARLGVPLADTFTVAGSWYTAIGSAVHYVTQNALARTGRLFGDWRCARPSCQHKVVKSFYPETCPGCGTSKIDYEELTLQDDAIGLRGHTDGLLVFKNHSSILEIKTSSQANVEKLLAATDAELALTFQIKSPYYGYWHQASSYVSLIRHWIKTDPAFSDIPYTTQVDFLIMSRDNPKTTIAITLPVPDDDHWYQEIKRRVIEAQKAVADGVVPTGFATTKEELNNLPTCKWCEYKDICLDPKMV